MSYYGPYATEEFDTDLLDNVIAFDSAIAFRADNTDVFEDGLPDEDDMLWYDNDDDFFPDAA